MNKHMLIGLQVFARMCFAGITLIIPATLFYLAFHAPGITISSAITSPLSFAAFDQFFTNVNPNVRAFWNAMPQTILYCLLTSLCGLLVSFIFVLNVAFRSSRSAASVSYFLLSLALLPQTFLVLSSLRLAAYLHFATSSGAVIVSVLILSLMPIACWATWMLAAVDVRRLLKDLAVDGASLVSAMRILVFELKPKLLQGGLIFFALTLGNFTIPFALGDNKTYTALIFLMSFSSNLGRDWALIAAASVFLLVPLITIGVIVGYGLSKLSRNN